jgi:hypothetical protein
MWCLCGAAAMYAKGHVSTARDSALMNSICVRKNVERDHSARGFVNDGNVDKQRS